MTASRPSLRLSTPSATDGGLALGLDFVISQQQQQQQQQHDTLVLNVCHSADELQHQQKQKQQQQQQQQQVQHEEYHHEQPQPFFITTTSAVAPTPTPTPSPPTLAHAYMPHKGQRQHPATHVAHAALLSAARDKKCGNNKSNSRCPAPIFIVLISLLEIGVFIYDYLTIEQTEATSSPTLATPSLGSTKDTMNTISADVDGAHIPSESVLIYRPDRRLQLWRFVSYMFLHANWFHLTFNVSVQTLYGVPLELQHGSLRVAVIYLAGVCAGSLGTSVIDANVYLVGASGGVYALLAAQFANVLMNYGQMRYSFTQLLAVCIFVTCDLGYALYMKYAGASLSSLHSYATSASSSESSPPTVSYIAHLTGALAGFTMGLLLLKPFDGRGQSALLWWLALSIYAAFTIFAIVFNLLNTMTAQLLEEEGEELGQHLLHDLGIS